MAYEYKPHFFQAVYILHKIDEILWYSDKVQKSQRNLFRTSEASGNKKAENSRFQLLWYWIFLDAYEICLLSLDYSKYLNIFTLRYNHVVNAR
jgi:hypothetical protein